MTSPTTLLAHAGPHDLTTGDGLLHTLTAPDHLLAAAACVAGAYVALALYRRLSSRRHGAATSLTPSPLYSGGRAGVGGIRAGDAGITAPPGAGDEIHSAADKGQG